MTTPDTIDYDQLRRTARLQRRRPDRSYRYAVYERWDGFPPLVVSWHRTPNAVREALARGPRLGVGDLHVYEVVEVAQ